MTAVRAGMPAVITGRPPQLGIREGVTGKSFPASWIALLLSGPVVCVCVCLTERIRKITRSLEISACHGGWLLYPTGRPGNSWNFIWDYIYYVVSGTSSTSANHCKAQACDVIRMHLLCQNSNSCPEQVKLLHSCIAMEVANRCKSTHNKRNVAKQL